MKKFSKAHFNKAQRKLDKKISSEEINNVSGGSEGSHSGSLPVVRGPIQIRNFNRRS
ncbi:MAG TPA: hypothetical protein PK657_11745 [Legionella sp.]|nr:hypothetical protein [Legionella sp.]